MSNVIVSEVLEAFSPAFKSVDLRIVAVKQHAQWVNVIASVFMSSKSLEEIKSEQIRIREKLPKTDRFNIFLDCYPSGGNHWTDYSGTDSYRGPYQNETGSDGIGDTPYVIDENNIDTYPLMAPFGPLTVKGENITVFPIDGVGLIFENVTAEGFTTVNKTETGPDPPSGFKLMEQYYSIKTTANYSDAIAIRIIYDDSNMRKEEENAIKLCSGMKRHKSGETLRPELIHKTT